jgi:hypothetical protein
MSGKKKRNAQKQKQRRAVKAKARKHLNNQMRHFIRRMSKSGNTQKHSVELPMGSQKDTLDLDSEISFPLCDGVGDCCKNRAVLIEPSDVFRILKNKRAQEKFGCTVTMDLQGKDDSKPLTYWIDSETGLLMCAVRRIEDTETGEQLCPFLEQGDVPTCLLGDDRPTFCKADPVGRQQRTKDKKRLSAWSYALAEDMCVGCAQASADENRQMRVVDWLNERSMGERYRVTDVFFWFAEWMHVNVKDKTLKELAAMLVFDWHRWVVDQGGLTREQAMVEGPKKPEDVMFAARQILEGIMQMEESKKSGDADSEQASE